MRLYKIIFSQILKFQNFQKTDLVENILFFNKFRKFTQIFMQTLNLPSVKS